MGILVVVVVEVEGASSRAMPHHQAQLHHLHCANEDFSDEVSIDVSWDIGCGQKAKSQDKIKTNAWYPTRIGMKNSNYARSDQSV